MNIPPMLDYDRTVATFRWELPPTFNFGRDVVDHLAASSDRLALIEASAVAPTRRYRFSDISAQSSQMAHVLKRGGVRAGDRVIVQLPRSAAWNVAMTACTKIGAIPIPCVEMLTAKDIAYRAQHSGAVAAVCSAKNIPKYDGCHDLRLKLSVDTAAAGWLLLPDEMKREDRFFECQDTAIDAPAILYYTSGSTGNPKGVTHAARALFAWRLSAAYWHGIGPGDITWCTADTGWSKSGTGVLFAPWGVGSAVVVYDGPFEPTRRLELIRSFGVTVFCAAATELRQLIKADMARTNFSGLRLCVSAGETVNPDLVRKWSEVTSVPLLDGYGQTETLMTILNYPCMKVKPGSMGKPIPGTEFDILDDQGARLPAGEAGQIAMKLPNPQFMLGYLDDPIRTQESIQKSGDQSYWLTGDLGYRDADGYFFYVGRSDDLINSGGYRIGPMEVESALMEHPAVQEAAVVAKPDAERGEIVKAFVVLRGSVQGSPTLIKELQDHVKATTAPYKYPRDIEFCAELPKNAAGKVLRRVLRNRSPAATGARDR